LIFLFDVLPKLLLALTLFIELIMFNRIRYFLFFIPLIFIPILFKIFLNLFIDFGERNLPVLKSYFSSIKRLDPYFNEKGELRGYLKYEATLKDEYVDVVDPGTELRLILQLQSITNYGLQIKENLNTMAPYLTIITSFMYFIAGFYRLFIILI